MRKAIRHKTVQEYLNDCPNDEMPRLLRSILGTLSHCYMDPVGNELPEDPDPIFKYEVTEEGTTYKLTASQDAGHMFAWELRKSINNEHHLTFVIWDHSRN